MSVQSLIKSQPRVTVTSIRHSHHVIHIGAIPARAGVRATVTRHPDRGDDEHSQSQFCDCCDAETTDKGSDVINDLHVIDPKELAILAGLLAGRHGRRMAVITGGRRERHAGGLEDFINAPLERMSLLLVSQHAIPTQQLYLNTLGVLTRIKVTFAVASSVVGATEIDSCGQDQQR